MIAGPPREKPPIRTAVTRFCALRPISSCDPDPVFSRRALFVGDPPTRVLQAGPQDQWFAADKARHFLISYGLVGFVFAGSRLAGMDRRAASATSVVAGFGASLTKELADRGQGKGFSLRDLVWDTAGIFVGVLVMQRTK